MVRFPPRLMLFGICDLVLICICLFHFPHVVDRPRFPFFVEENGDAITVGRIIDAPAADGIRSGDTLLTWNGERLRIPESALLLAELSSIGTRADAVIQRQGTSLTRHPSLIPYYPSAVAIIVIFVTGLATVLIGMFIFYRQPSNPTATTLHWTLVGVGVAVMTDWGTIDPSSIQTYLVRTLFVLSYMTVAAGFLIFSTQFPRENKRLVPHRRVVTYGVSIVLSVIMIHHHLNAIAYRSIDSYVAFQDAFDVFHAVLLIFVGIGLFLFAYSFATSVTTKERLQLLWILWGCGAGSLPFLLLIVMPQFFNMEMLLPEEYGTLFFLAIPASFAISIVRHRWLDITVLITRSTVYSIVLAVVVIAYAGTVGAVSVIVGTMTATISTGVSTAAAVFVALLFEPLRMRTQQWVDKKFFRVRYNFRETQRVLTEEIAGSYSDQQIATRILTRIRSIIPVERIGCFVVDPSAGTQTIAADGFSPEQLDSLFMMVLPSHENTPCASGESVEPGINFDQANDTLFTAAGLAYLQPVILPDESLWGFLAFGPKKSEDLFTFEDADLFVAIARSAAAALERLRLQQRLILEHAEAERSSELSKMKSLLVSGISHDLKTPLTAISMFADLLSEGGHIRSRKTKEYIDIISGESNRLAHMINTVLDYARVERGIKEYLHEPVELNEVIRRVLKIMEYQFKASGFSLTDKQCRHKLRLAGDPDALRDVFTNILANAMKYSPHEKAIAITTQDSGSTAIVSISDHGMGIAPEDLPHLFEPYYRSTRDGMRHIGGTGLGLALVKEIVDAHRGIITVDSTVGKGTTFTLSFPMENSHEASTHRRRRSGHRTRT